MHDNGVLDASICPSAISTGLSDLIGSPHDVQIIVAGGLAQLHGFVI